MHFFPKGFSLCDYFLCLQCAVGEGWSVVGTRDLGVMGMKQVLVLLKQLQVESCEFSAVWFSACNLDNVSVFLINHRIIEVGRNLRMSCSSPIPNIKI